MAHGIGIILNGVSSSGKTSLAHVLQDKLEEPYYYLSQDMFTHLLSQRHRNQDFWGSTTQSVSALHHTIACFLSLGLNVIVDHLLLDIPRTKGWLDECVQLLQPYPVLFIQVWCPLPELEHREAARGDRQPGQAKKQLAQRYPASYYDLTVNTAEHALATCAEQIIALLAQPNPGSAFDRLRAAQLTTTPDKPADHS